MFQMSNIVSRLIVITATVALITVVAGPGEVAAQNRSPLDADLKTDVAGFMIREGVKAYFHVFGEWPDSWANVVGEQLVQVPLIGMYGGEVDPDDGSWEFDRDIQFLPAEEGNGPKLAVFTDYEGMRIRIDPLNPVLSYADRFGSGSRGDFESELLDQSRLKQWAIGGLLQTSMTLYLTVYEEYPATFEDFISAGVTPIDCCSINPLTGDCFYGDGRPNDFKYLPQVDKETGEITAANIWATDAQGEIPWLFIY